MSSSYYEMSSSGVAAGCTHGCYIGRTVLQRPERPEQQDGRRPGCRRPGRRARAGARVEEERRGEELPELRRRLETAERDAGEVAAGERDARAGLADMGRKCGPCRGSCRGRAGRPRRSLSGRRRWRSSCGDEAGARPAGGVACSGRRDRGGDRGAGLPLPSARHECGRQCSEVQCSDLLHTPSDP